MRTHNLLLHHIGGRVTAAGATLTAPTMHAGDSLTVMSGMGRAFLMDLWSLSQAAGITQMHSPKMHDDNTGLKIRTLTALNYPGLPFPCKQELAPQDTLKVEMSGSATAGDIESFGSLIYYQSPGSAGGRFITYPELINNMSYLVTLDFSVTAGTAGGYSGVLAFSAANEDKLKGNTDYAILGLNTSIQQASVTIKSPDTGNMRVGVPGSLNREITRDWFVRMARGHNDPFIPVFNSAQKSATYVEVVNDENAASPVITVYLALLR